MITWEGEVHGSGPPPVIEAGRKVVGWVGRLARRQRRVCSWCRRTVSRGLGSTTHVMCEECRPYQLSAAELVTLGSLHENAPGQLGEPDTGAREGTRPARKIAGSASGSNTPHLEEGRERAPGALPHRRLRRGPRTRGDACDNDGGPR